MLVSGRVNKSRYGISNEQLFDPSARYFFGGTLQDKWLNDWSEEQFSDHRKSNGRFKKNGCKDWDKKTTADISIKEN